MPTERKIKIVEKLKEKLSRAKSVVLADYQGLSALQMNQIKRTLDEKQGELLVVKNTLLKIALKSFNRETFEGITNELGGPTAVLFAYEDPIEPLRTLKKLSQEFDLPKIKCGVVEEQFYGAPQIAEIAILPPREILLSQLARCLNNPWGRLVATLSNPHRKLVFTLSAISSKRG